MLIFSVDALHLDNFYTMRGSVDFKNYGLFASLLSESLLKDGRAEDAHAVVSAAGSGERLTFAPPVELCFWSPTARSACVASCSGVHFTTVAPSPGGAPSSTITRLFFSEVHQPHFSEILEAFTSAQLELF